jgi:hypothetical protein
MGLILCDFLLELATAFGPEGFFREEGRHVFFRGGDEIIHQGKCETNHRSSNIPLHRLACKIQERVADAEEAMLQPI